MVTATVLRDRPGEVVIEAIEGDGGRLPLVAEKNCVGIAAIETLKLLGQPSCGVSLRLKKVGGRAGRVGGGGEYGWDEEGKRQRAMHPIRRAGRLLVAPGKVCRVRRVCTLRGAWPRPAATSSCPMHHRPVGDLTRLTFRDRPQCTASCSQSQHPIRPACVPIPHCTPHRAARSCHRRCLQGLPLGSGMGSSAASAAAGAWAVNALFGSPLGKDTLVYAGLASEAAVSGYHADNIAPALMGGFILIRCGLILHTVLCRGQDPDHTGSIQPHPYGRLHADQVSRPLRRVW